jgi:hypothetical protein
VLSKTGTARITRNRKSQRSFKLRWPACGLERDKQVNLKASLGTKDIKTANVRAKPALAEFDRIIREATALVAQPRALKPLRTSLNTAEVTRMAEALYGKLLADDEMWRFGGRAQMARGEAWLRREGIEFTPFYRLDEVPEYGWSDEQLRVQKDNLVHELDTMQDALARGDISAVVDDVALLLADFQIDLDPTSKSYHALGTQALQAYVRALQAIEKRNAGQPIETPKFTPDFRSAPVLAGRFVMRLKVGRKSAPGLRELSTSIGALLKCLSSCTVIWLWWRSNGRTRASIGRRSKQYLGIARVSSAKPRCLS